ncbi:MAG TPA: NAD(P)H-dependent oxidoreductase [Xanthomonadales bacterium]|nr:NAD(P)H-dependent oxidoreductase [Xanthomonadales bacterium]
MADAIVGAALATGEVEVIARRAADATLDDLRAADGYVFGTPETFGSLSGMLKDFFERTFYPAQGLLQGRPYALFVCAGNDGRGAVAATQRIARGYGWREVQPALVVPSDAVELRLKECEDLGTTMALGLSMGVL